jgi:hypothetical protein
MKKRRELPSKELLLTLFEYKDGVLVWKKKTARYVVIGKKAGDYKSNYGQVNIYGVAYLLHRVIYKMFYGIEPNYIDHIDGDPKNNRIENLQAVTQSKNIRKGRRSESRNKSGFKGVSFRPNRNKWRARITIDKKEICLGHFVNYEDAIKARLLADKI